MRMRGRAALALAQYARRGRGGGSGVIIGVARLRLGWAELAGVGGAVALLLLPALHGMAALARGSG